MAEQPIVLQQYPDTLVDSIGVWGNDEEVHALYSVQAGVPVALVGLRVEKDSESLHAYLDAMYVLPFHTSGYHPVQKRYVVTEPPYG